MYYYKEASHDDDHRANIVVILRWKQKGLNFTEAKKVFLQLVVETDSTVV